MKHTLGRHKRLYGLFKETGTHNHRHVLVGAFSDGRTEDSGELSDMETDMLIRHLESMKKERQFGTPEVNKPGQQMRRRILSLCYSCGWTKYDTKQQKPVVDFEKLEAWMHKYSYLHKGINDYLYEELPQLVTQFENMAKSILTT